MSERLWSACVNILTTRSDLITLQYIKTTSALFRTLSANFPPPENSPADFGGPQSAT